MFRDLVPFGRRFRDPEDIFTRILGEFEESFLPSTSNMKVDIKENEKEYIVEAEIPGVDKEQININYDHNYLTISVENRQEIKEERENYIRRERKVGKASRGFYVENVKEDEIVAKYDKGLLKVILPKSEDKKKTGRIKIQ